MRTFRQKGKASASFAMQSPTQENWSSAKVEKGQSLLTGLFCGRFTNKRRLQVFVVEILEKKGLWTANKFLFVKFILRNLRDLSSDSLKLGSSQWGLDIDKQNRWRQCLIIENLRGKQENSWILGQNGYIFAAGQGMGCWKMFLSLLKTGYIISLFI